MEKIQERRLINANRIAFMLAGLGVACWGPMIPYVQERFVLDAHELGLLLLCMGMGSMVSMPLAGMFTTRLGCKFMVRAASVIVVVCLSSIPFVMNLYAMGCILFVFGISTVMLDVTANINAARVELMVGRPIMSGLHGVYSVGNFIGSLGVAFLLSLGLDLHFAGFASSVFVAFVALSGTTHLLTRHNAAVAGEDEDTGPKRVLHPLVIFIGVLCFIMFMTEASMLDWSAVFLRDELHVPIEHAGYAFSAFAIAMTAFRLSGDKFVQLLGRRRVLVIGTVCIFAGYSIVVMVPNFMAALVGYAIIGVGASNVVPQLVSYTVSIKGVSINGAVTVVNAIGFSGSLMGPALIGFSAHQIGLPNTFMCQAVAVLFVGVSCFVVLRRKVQAKKEQQ